MMKKSVYLNLAFLLLPFFVLSQKKVLNVNSFKKAVIIQYMYDTSAILIADNVIYYGKYIEFTSLFKSYKKVISNDSSVAFIYNLTYDTLVDEEPNFLIPKIVCDGDFHTIFYFIKNGKRKSFDIPNAFSCNGKFLANVHSKIKFIKSLNK